MRIGRVLAASLRETIASPCSSWSRLPRGSTSPRSVQSYGHGDGHVFNLGHGIHPEINPEHVAVLVDAVHELSKEYH